MTHLPANEIATLLGAEIISLPFPEKKAGGAYCSDLLSWVMGHANPDDVWVTIMTNKNVLAVASLIDFCCVVICENAELDEEFISTAKDKEINVIRCAMDNYHACAALSGVLGGK
mgnify:CR=1 FL=1